MASRMFGIRLVVQQAWVWQPIPRVPNRIILNQGMRNKSNDSRSPSNENSELPPSKRSIEPRWLRQAKEAEKQQQQERQQRVRRGSSEYFQTRRKTRHSRTPIRTKQSQQAPLVVGDTGADRVLAREPTRTPTKKWPWKRDAAGKQLGHLSLQEIVDLLNAENAQRMVVIDLRSRTNVWVDYMIVVEGFSARHLGGMGDLLVEQLKGRKIPEISNAPYVEGRDCTDWMVVSTGNVAVQLFMPEAREYYDIESLWSNMDVEDWVEPRMLSTKARLHFVQEVSEALNTSKKIVDSEIVDSSQANAAFKARRAKRRPKVKIYFNKSSKTEQQAPL